MLPLLFFHTILKMHEGVTLCACDGWQELFEGKFTRFSRSAKARDAKDMGGGAGPDDRPAKERKKDAAFQHAWQGGCLKAEQRDPGFAARMLKLGRYVATGAGPLFDPERDNHFPVPGDKWVAALRWVTGISAAHDHRAGRDCARACAPTTP